MWFHEVVVMVGSCYFFALGVGADRVSSDDQGVRRGRGEGDSQGEELG